MHCDFAVYPDEGELCDLCWPKMCCGCECVCDCSESEGVLRADGDYRTAQGGAARRHLPHQLWNKAIHAGHGNTTVTHKINFNVSANHALFEHELSYDGVDMPKRRFGMPDPGWIREHAAHDVKFPHLVFPVRGLRSSDDVIAGWHRSLVTALSHYDAAREYSIQVV